MVPFFQLFLGRVPIHWKSTNQEASGAGPFFSRKSTGHLREGTPGINSVAPEYPNLQTCKTALPPDLFNTLLLNLRNITQLPSGTPFLGRVPILGRVPFSLRHLGIFFFSTRQRAASRASRLRWRARGSWRHRIGKGKGRDVDVFWRERRARPPP